MDRRDLATWLHREYEEIAVEVGWETQDGTSVPFDDLPDDNREVMLQMADRLLETFPGLESADVDSGNGSGKGDTSSK